MVLVPLAFLVPFPLYPAQRYGLRTQQGGRGRKEAACKLGAGRRGREGTRGGKSDLLNHLASDARRREGQSAKCRAHSKSDAEVEAEERPFWRANRRRTSSTLKRRWRMRGCRWRRNLPCADHSVSGEGRRDDGQVGCLDERRLWRRTGRTGEHRGGRSPTRGLLFLPASKRLWVREGRKRHRGGAGWKQPCAARPR